MSKLLKLQSILSESVVQIKKDKYLFTNNPEDVLLKNKVKLGDTLADVNGKVFNNAIGLDNKVAIITDNGNEVIIYEEDPAIGLSVTSYTREEFRLIADLFRKFK